MEKAKLVEKYVLLNGGENIFDERPVLICSDAGELEDACEELSEAMEEDFWEQYGKEWAAEAFERRQEDRERDGLELEEFDEEEEKASYCREYRRDCLADCYDARGLYLETADGLEPLLQEFDWEVDEMIEETGGELSDITLADIKFLLGEILAQDGGERAAGLLREALAAAESEEIAAALAVAPASRRRSL